MARFLNENDKSFGLAPGSLVFVGDKKQDRVRFKSIIYNDEIYKEGEINSVEEFTKNCDEASVNWLNVDGLHEAEIINQIKQKFNIHSLVAEDILNTGQRPKIDIYPDHIYVTLKLLNYNPEIQKIESDQFSLILGNNWVLTFQEKEAKYFEPVRDRIRNKSGRIRSRKAEYLAYALLDIITDNYLKIVEEVGSQIEDLEQDILDDKESIGVEKISLLKKEINFLRKVVRPLREIVFAMGKTENNLISENIYSYLKDLEDHILLVTESIDSYKEILSDLFNVYNSKLSNKLNDVMKVLTIFASIFIPLTFFAGIYGMNFEYLPELKLEYGYFYFWGLILVLGGIMVYYFKKKKWI